MNGVYVLEIHSPQRSYFLSKFYFCNCIKSDVPFILFYINTFHKVASTVEETAFSNHIDW